LGFSGGMVEKFWSYRRVDLTIFTLILLEFFTFFISQ
jgi:hypothetical protein